MDGYMDGWMDGWTDGWMDGQMTRQMGGWTDIDNKAKVRVPASYSSSPLTSSIAAGKDIFSSLFLLANKRPLTLPALQLWIFSAETLETLHHPPALHGEKLTAAMGP